MDLKITLFTTKDRKCNTSRECLTEIVGSVLGEKCLNPKQVSSLPQLCSLYSVFMGKKKSKKLE